MQPARSPNATIRRPRTDKNTDKNGAPVEASAAPAETAPVDPDSFDSRWDARPDSRPQGRPDERGPRPAERGPRPDRRENRGESRRLPPDGSGRPLPRTEGAPVAPAPVAPAPVAPAPVAPAPVAEQAPRPPRMERRRHENPTPVAALEQAAAQEERQERQERRDGSREERLEDRGGDRGGDRGRRPEAPLPLPTRGTTDFAGLQDIANLPRSELDALMAGYGPRGPAQRLRRGQRVEGRLSRVTSAAAFIDIGGKADAILEGRDLPPGAKPGDLIEAFVASSPFEGEVRLTLSPSGAAALDMLDEAKDHRTILSGKVQGMNDHGYEILLNGGIRGFCPTSQIDVQPIADPAIYVGQTMGFRVLEVKGREAIVTHRSIAEEEAAVAAVKLFEAMREGDVYEGTVTKLKEFGAFVRLPNGLEGLVHLSNISKERIAKPEDKLKEGQEVKVKVLSVEPATRRLSLGIKQAEHSAGAIGDTRGSEMRQRTSFGLLAGLLAGVKPKKK